MAHSAATPAPRTEDSARWLVPAALLTVYIVWGSTYFAIKLVLESFPPFLMAGARFIVAGALLFGICRVRGEPVPTFRQWRAALLVGLLLLVCGNGLVVFAQRSVASGLAAILIASVSLWATLFSGLFGLWPTLRQWAGIAVGMSGLVVLNLGSDLRGNPVGVGMLLLAAMSWAFGSVLSRRLDLPPGAMASACEMLCGGVVMLVLGAVRGELIPQTATTSAVLAFLYLTLFGSLLAFSAYVLLLKRASAAVATSYGYVNPVVAVLLGVGFGGERIGTQTVVALGVILSGVALVALGPKTSR
jgi:drug/metabolite transporter (DMT)-like permease